MIAPIGRAVSRFSDTVTRGREPGAMTSESREHRVGVERGTIREDFHD